MKPIRQTIKPFLPYLSALAVFLISIAAISAAQSKSDGPVKVKIVKIVDGDTTTIEKTMDEAGVKDFTKQFENIKGKNVQLMITVEDVDKGKHTSCKSSCQSSSGQHSNSSMHFNFNMDSSTAHSFAKAFAFSDSGAGNKFTWNDTNLLKNFPKNFDFNFDFDDEGTMNDFDFDINTDESGKTVVIKNKDGKTIVISGDDENPSISSSESNNGKTKTRTIVINDEKGKGKKKVIVSTSVLVIDMDDDGKTERRNAKEESSFNFYPNPSDGNFVLDMDLNGKDDAQVKITDMYGKVVYNEKITGNGKVTKTIDLSGKKGTFIVTIKQGKRTDTKKIIIE